MPVYDPHRQCLVVRVVFDGSAFAGKTTTLTRISELFPVEKRSELYTPGALKGRTMFFDWLEVEAGRVGQLPLMCQLLTVPGQGQRSYRRKPLLQLADAVVFVADSRRELLPEARKTFTQLKAQLRNRYPEQVPVLVQANKQDVPDAFTTDELRRLLRLGDRYPIFATNAESGAGLRETLVAAIRTSVLLVREMIKEHGLEALMGDSGTGDQLFESLLALEEDEGREYIPEPSQEDLASSTPDDELGQDASATVDSSGE